MAKRPRNKTEIRPELSRLELQVMDTVWELGECSSAEVIEAFTASKRRLAPTTIRTVLANLRKKGYLEPVPTIERGYRLRATVTRASVAKRWTRYLVNTLFGESPRRAIAYLLQSEKIDEEDLEEIRRLIDTRKHGGKRH
jgi:BlaI family penicillinase repressor